jgi:O-antigen/teichoic acid export membrane protein
VLRLLKGVSLGMSARAVYVFCQWLQIAIVARAAEPAVVGAYGLALAIATPIFLFCNSSLRAEFLTLSRSSPARFAIYFVLRIGMACVALALTGLLGILLYPLDLFLVILLVGLMKAAEAIGDILQAWLERRRRFDMVLVTLSVRGLSGALSFLIVFALGGTLAQALLLQVLTVLLLLALCDLRLVVRTSRLPARMWLCHFFPSEHRLQFGGTITRPPGVLAIPDTLFRRRHLLFRTSWLGAAGFGTSLIHNIPRYIVEARMGLDALGYFTALYYVIHAGSMLVTSGTAALLHPMSKLIASRDFGRLAALVVLAAAGILGGSAIVWLVFFFFGERILAMLYGPEYAVYTAAFLVILAAGSLRFIWMFLCQALIAWRRFATHFVLITVCLILSFLIYWMTISNESFDSIGYGMAASYFFAVLIYISVLLILGLLNGRPIKIGTTAKGATGA